MIKVVLSENQNVPFYDTNIFGMIVGFIASLITIAITQYILHIREKKKSKKTLILAITQSNSALFSQIFQGSMGNIDYIKIRDELKNSNISYLFAGKLREEFVTLHKIFFTNPDYYIQHKNSIKQHLINIIVEIENYGDDVLEHK